MVGPFGLPPGTGLVAAGLFDPLTGRPPRVRFWGVSERPWLAPAGFDPGEDPADRASPRLSSRRPIRSGAMDGLAGGPGGVDEELAADESSSFPPPWPPSSAPSGRASGSHGNVDEIRALGGVEVILALELCRVNLCE